MCLSMKLAGVNLVLFAVSPFCAVPPAENDADMPQLSSVKLRMFNTCRLRPAFYLS